MLTDVKHGNILSFLSKKVSEIVCLRNQNIFNACRIDCLVDRKGMKGIGLKPDIVSNFSQSKKTLYSLLYLCSRKLKSVL